MHETLLLQLTEGEDKVETKGGGAREAVCRSACVRPEDAEKRKKSGWFGSQDPERLRMKGKITDKALQEKAKCPEDDLNKPGIYQLTYKPTGAIYIGKTKEQTISKRVKQHLTVSIAGDDKKLTGKVDPLLQKDPDESKWELKVKPVEKKKVDKTEADYIKKSKPSLNIQQPDP